MAIIVKKAAAGNSPATGMQRTPPARVIPTAPDEVTQVRAPTKAGLGMNGYSGASSAPMSAIPESPLGANLRASVDDDGVLSELIAGGSAKGDGGDIRGSSQLRTVSDKSLAPAMGMVRQQDSDAVLKGTASMPTKNGSVDSDYLVRRAMALKRTQ
jgi:hypothetical protein